MAVQPLLNCYRFFYILKIRAKRKGQVENVTWKKKWLVGLCVVVLVMTMPDNLQNPTNIYASEQFLVAPKEKATFFVGEPIEEEQFTIMLGQQKLESGQVLMEPKVCSQSGICQIWFSYDTANGYYQKKVFIEVRDIVIDSIQPEQESIRLVRGQEVTKEQLPTMYATYNNGTKTELTDYACEMNWEKELLAISYGGTRTLLEVEVVDSTLEYIQVFSKKNTVAADYMFQKEDMQVMAYYADGTCMEVTEYQILPYTLSNGVESRITVQYEGKMADFVIKTENEKETIVEDKEEEKSNSLIFPTPTAILEQPNLLLTPTPTVTEEAKWGDFSEKEEGIDNEVVARTGVPQTIDKVSDTKKPKTNVKNKVYKKNVTITFSDAQSGVKSAQLSGAWNGIISSGYVLKKEGAYTLTITDQAGNEKVVSFSIQKPAKKVKLSCEGTSSWKKIQFRAKVIGTKRTVTWKSSNTSIGTISEKGVFCAKCSGSCYIKATIDKITVKKKIQVLKKEKCILVY